MCGARGVYKGPWDRTETAYYSKCAMFEINQLLFAEDTELVADSEEKLCRLVS